MYEVCCGLYYPTISSLRSLSIPESIRSTVLNWFRVPLNICVVLVLLYVDKVDDQSKFWGCAILMGIGLVSSISLMHNLKKCVSANPKKTR
jgi:hypothetical protein